MFGMLGSASICSLHYALVSKPRLDLMREKLNLMKLQPSTQHTQHYKLPKPGMKTPC